MKFRFLILAAFAGGLGVACAHADESARTSPAADDLPGFTGGTTAGADPKNTKPATDDFTDRTEGETASVTSVKTKPATDDFTDRTGGASAASESKNTKPATDDDLRIQGIFNSALPGTEKKNSLRLILHPHLGDLTNSDYLRTDLG